MISKGPWPTTKQPGDMAFAVNGKGEVFRIDRFGTVIINGQIVATTPVLIEDTRDYLETITGGA